MVLIGALGPWDMAMQTLPSFVYLVPALMLGSARR